MVMSRSGSAASIRWSDAGDAIEVYDGDQHVVLIHLPLADLSVRLPTLDPHVKGVWFSNIGVVTISAG